MKNDCTSDDILYVQLLDINAHPGVTIAGGDGRKITGMIGMRLIIGIVVSACVGKTMGTISVLMDVEAIKGWNVGWCIEG